MMKVISRRQLNSVFLVGSPLLFSLLIVTACGAGGNGTPTGSSTPTPRTSGATPSITISGTANPSSTPVSVSTPGGDVITPAPGVRLGVQSCPAAVKDP